MAYDKHELFYFIEELREEAEKYTQWVKNHYCDADGVMPSRKEMYGTIRDMGHAMETVMEGVDRMLAYNGPRKPSMKTVRRAFMSEMEAMQDEVRCGDGGKLVSAVPTNTD